MVITKNKNNFICPYPWTSLHVWPNGDISPCCNSDRITKSDGTIYNINTDTLEDARSSQWMSLLRQDFRNGIRPKSCHYCWQEEDTGKTSMRQYATFTLQRLYDRIDWESEGILMQLGGHFIALCNLKCRICSSDYSSSIATEEILELENIDQGSSSILKKKLKINANVNQQKIFWQKLTKHVDTIKHYTLFGGEPLLSKQNLEFIKFLVDQNLSKDIVLEFFTNGTQYPVDIINLFKEFAEVSITFSIDNIKEKFEVERSGANWQQVENNIKNLLKISNLHKNIRIGVLSTINIQNVCDYPELVNWCRSIDILGYDFSILSHPSYLSIENLTTKGKQLALERLSTIAVHPDDQHKLNYIIDIIKNSQGSDGSEFCKEMKRFDKLRNQNFAVTHSDIAKAMGYD